MAEQHGGYQKVRLMSFRDRVPDKLRFWFYIFFLITFQFSNGIYFAAMSQVQGSMAITMNDVKMLTHAVLIGLTMYFPLAFRLKFRFTNKTCLLAAAAGMMLCNLSVPHIHSVPLLVAVCIIAGFLRLFGTFECFSSILPKITPTYNYGVFLSFVFFVVLGVINLFDIVSCYLIYYYSWEYVHLFSVLLLSVTIILIIIFMKHFRFKPMMPLFGIDFLGMILWIIFIMSLIFIAQYGNQLDWLHSPYIRFAAGTAFISLGFNIARMTYIRHPFIDAAAFKAKNLINLLLLFLFFSILISCKNILQNIYTSAVLHFDQLNTASLKWFEFAGMFLGAVFSWYTITKFNLSKKLLTFIGMSGVVLYILFMYFLISPYTNIEKFYFPLICCGFGHVVIFIVLTVYAQATAPFVNYFQVICILGLIRTGLGSPIGDAIFTYTLNGLIPKYMNSIILFSNQAVTDTSVFYIQALTASIRELFGRSFIFGMVILMLICISHFKQNLKYAVPTLQSFYNLMRKTR